MEAPQIPSESSMDDGQKDVWSELFGVVQGLAETVDLALQAFTPGDDKAVSATTKKRLAIRSIQGLKQSQQGLQTLQEHLKALQAASQTWQRSMMYASKSHQELMEQVETSTRELHTTSERLRAVEGQRLAAVREAEGLRAQVATLQSSGKDAAAALKAREEELETLQFQLHELQAGTSAAAAAANLDREAAQRAEERATAAVASLDEARAEATRAHGLAERHQQVVAKLTADNLVFLMQLKKAEADLAAANQERTQLRLAAEKQRGPWFDQVRAGVEERVRLAMRRAEELEEQLERTRAEHAEQLQAVAAARDEVEGQLGDSRRQVAQLQGMLDAATDAQQRADLTSASAEASASELRSQLEALGAENRVLQESVRSMRQECTERWVSEQSALGRVGGLEERIASLEEQLAAAGSEAAALRRQLDVQLGVNRQLMAKKEEVEWQLMAAMAKVDGGAADGPVPLNLRVSGLLQVGGKEQQAAAHGATATLHPVAAFGASAAAAERSERAAAPGDPAGGGGHPARSAGRGEATSTAAAPAQQTSQPAAEHLAQARAAQPHQPAPPASHSGQPHQQHQQQLHQHQPATDREHRQGSQQRVNLEPLTTLSAFTRTLSEEPPAYAGLRQQVPAAAAASQPPLQPEATLWPHQAHHTEPQREQRASAPMAGGDSHTATGNQQQVQQEPKSQPSQGRQEQRGLGGWRVGGTAASPARSSPPSSVALSPDAGSPRGGNPPSYSNASQGHQRNGADGPGGWPGAAQHPARPGDAAGGQLGLGFLWGGKSPAAQLMARVQQQQKEQPREQQEQPLQQQHASAVMEVRQVLPGGYVDPDSGSDTASTDSEVYRMMVPRSVYRARVDDAHADQPQQQPQGADATPQPRPPAIVMRTAPQFPVRSSAGAAPAAGTVGPSTGKNTGASAGASTSMDVDGPLALRAPWLAGVGGGTSPASSYVGYSPTAGFHDGDLGGTGSLFSITKQLPRAVAARVQVASPPHPAYSRPTTPQASQPASPPHPTAGTSVNPLDGLALHAGTSAGMASAGNSGAQRAGGGAAQSPVARQLYTEPGPEQRATQQQRHEEEKQDQVQKPQPGSDGAAVQLRVQAGPLYYATAGALSGSDLMAGMPRWPSQHSDTPSSVAAEHQGDVGQGKGAFPPGHGHGYGQGSNSEPETPKSASSHGAQGQGLSTAGRGQLPPGAASPGSSTGRMVRSPSHPAYVVVDSPMPGSGGSGVGGGGNVGSSALTRSWEQSTTAHAHTYGSGAAAATAAALAPTAPARQQPDGATVSLPSGAPGGAGAGGATAGFNGRPRVSFQGLQQQQGPAEVGAYGTAHGRGGGSGSVEAGVGGGMPSSKASSSVSLSGGAAPLHSALLRREDSYTGAEGGAHRGSSSTKSVRFSDDDSVQQYKPHQHHQHHHGRQQEHQGYSHQQHHHRVPGQQEQQQSDGVAGQQDAAGTHHQRTTPRLMRTNTPHPAADTPSRRLLNRMNTPYHRSMDDNDNDDDGFSDGSDMLAQPSSSNGSEGDDERSDRPVGGSSSSSRPVGGHGASGSGHAAGPAFAGHSAGPAGPAPRVPPSAAERVLSPRQGAPAHVRMSVGHPAMVLAASSYKREAGPQAGGPGAKAGAGDDLDDVLGPLEGHGGRLSGAAVAVTRAQPWA